MVDREHFYLGVDRSATGRAWIDALDLRGANSALAMAQKYGLNDALARILAARGIGDEDIANHLNPTIRQLMVDPERLVDLQVAGRRIADAITARESVAIFGDYDVDGACSSALFARFFRFFGVNSEIYIPDRITEGYGPNTVAMRALAAKGVQLIVTVDCGSNSPDAIRAAQKQGCDVIVIDHHHMDEVHHEAIAHVNPNRPDDVSGQGHLCAAGVVFMTLVEVCRVLRQKNHGELPDLLSYLDLVALATICDVVPLIGVNRAFVNKGLIVLRSQQNLGVRALIKAANISEPVNTYHLGYILGPRINAAGRIGDQTLGARLLSAVHDGEAESIANALENLNIERQALEAAQLEEAEAQIFGTLDPANLPEIIVVAGQWHPGIVGLLASRIKERYHRPTFALAVCSDGTARGSGRSIPGIDIGRLARQAVEKGIITRGGGHSMAAGVMLASQSLASFRSWLNQETHGYLKNDLYAPQLVIDSVISLEAINNAFIQSLEQVGPYGSANEQPMFAIISPTLTDARVVGKGHIGLTIKDYTGHRLRGIAFKALDSALGRFLLENRGAKIHIAGYLTLNYWNGTASPQITVIDAALPR